MDFHNTSGSVALIAFQSRGRPVIKVSILNCQMSIRHLANACSLLEPSSPPFGAANIRFRNYRSLQAPPTLQTFKIIISEKNKLCKNKRTWDLSEKAARGECACAGGVGE